MTTYGETPAAAGAGSLWVFEQLGGERKRLELSDHAAPHGRPRKGAVVSDGIFIVNQETRYPGNNEPDRHLYGVENEPFDLEGRFRDYWGGLGFAKAKTEEVKQFVADQQQVLITWGDVTSVTGFIERFFPSRESRGDVPWTMTIRIDRDNLIGGLFTIPEQQTPTDFTEEIQAALVDVDELVNEPTSLRGSVVDVMSSFIAGIASATASCARVADQIDSFTSAPAELLAQFRAALGQLKTAIIRARTAIEDMPVDLAIEADRAEEQQRWFLNQSGFSSTAATVLGVVAEADRAAVMGERGQFRAMHVAREGETWEDISRQHYDGPERAGDIRDANGVEPGQPPVAGTFYRIPV